MAEEKNRQNTQELLDLLREQNKQLENIHWYCGFFAFAIVVRFIWEILRYNGIY